MTYDELRKIMELIVRKQGEFDDGMNALRASHAKAEVRMRPFIDALGLYGTLSFELPEGPNPDLNSLRVAQDKAKSTLKEFIFLMAQYLGPQQDHDESPDV